MAVSLITVGLLLGVVGSVLLCENGLRLPVDSRKNRVIAHADEVSIEASDAIRLKASWLAPKDNQAGTVVLFHGVADSRAGVSGQAAMFTRHRFRVLAADSRGHGKSGGDMFTFGVREVDDVRRWVSWIESKYPGEPVFGLGESMGASILLQAAGAGVPFRAVVAESPFRTFRDVAEYRTAQASVVGPLFITPAFWYARLRYGFDLDTASPLAAMRQMRVPTLIIYGTADTNIPPSHGRDLAEAGGACAEFWSVPGGTHTDAISRQPAEFEKRVVAWFSATAPRPGCPRP